MELPVQRLVLILPAEEQPQEVLAGLGGFPPMPRGRGLAPQAIVQIERGEPADQPRQPLRVEVGEPAEGEILDLPRGLPQRERGRRAARR